MDSSTLPSSSPQARRQIPHGALLLLCTAVGSLLLCILYTVAWNPEIRFFRGVAELKWRFADSVSAAGQAKVVIFGGSSCAFSINGERMRDEHHIPLVNCGLGAGLGAKVLAHEAVATLRTGDTLIVALEPSHLTYSLEPPLLGIQHAFARGHLDWVTENNLGLDGVPTLSALLALRPGGYHGITLLGKVLGRRPLYRYKITEVSPSGWQQTDVRTDIAGSPSHGPQLSPDGIRFLRALRDLSEKKGVRIAYSLPWLYTPVAKAGEYQESCRRFLFQVAEFIPVLRDPRLGAYTVREHFSDTVWHLTVEGSNLRTDTLAQQLKKWEIWARADLQARTETR